MSPLARAVLDALAADPDARAELAGLLAPHLAPPPEPERPPFYTVTRLHERTGMSKKKIRNELNRRTLPGVKLGNEWIIPADGADALAAPLASNPARASRPRRKATAGNVGRELREAMGLRSVD